MNPIVVLTFLFVTLLTSAFSWRGDKDFDEMANRMGKGKAPFITAKKLDEWFKGAEEIIVLDTREKKEFNISHIEGANFAGYDQFDASKMDVLQEKNAKIVCYCSVGYRSQKIAEKLLKLGYKNVYNLYGGMFNWVNLGYPVVDLNGKETQKVHAFNKSWGKWLKKGDKVY